MGYCNGFGGLFWGVRRDNLVTLTQKIKQSNHNVQSEKRRIYKESRRTHSKNNQTVWRAGKCKWPIHKSRFYKYFTTSQLLGLPVSFLQPPISKKKNPVPESKLVSPSFKTRESYLGFLSLVYAATFAGSAFMPVLSARSDFVHRYCLTWQVKLTVSLLSLTSSTTCSAFVLFFTTRF